MPLDATGTYRNNHEQAAFHSKAAGKEYKADAKPKEQGEEGEGDHVEIHSHGDGTFHTMHGGEKMEHPTHGHALIHAANAHAEEGHKHFHAHHDGESMHSHSANGGETESRDHEDEQGAHGHMDEVMGGENPDGEEAEGEEQPQHAGAGLGGLY